MPFENHPQMLTGFEPTAPSEPTAMERATAYADWLERRWPGNAMVQARYWADMNTRAAFCAGEQWERTRGVEGSDSRTPGNEKGGSDGMADRSGAANGTHHNRNRVTAPTVTDEELSRRFTRCAYPGPNPMYRCNGCGAEEYGVRNLLVEHVLACGVPGTPNDQNKGGDSAA